MFQIFCSTRKSVEMTARHIKQNLTINLNPSQKEKLLQASKLIQDSNAKQTLIHGVGYHHAGLLPETKRAIEDLFRNCDLPILVTTSTLAMGVNLPAHLVIVKSTKCYTSRGYEDYPETVIMQMIGRAGRPQFDTSATAIIMTTADDKVNNQLIKLIVYLLSGYFKALSSYEGCGCGCLVLECDPRHESGLAVDRVLDRHESSVRKVDIVLAGYTSGLITGFVLAKKRVRRRVVHFVIEIVLEIIRLSGCLKGCGVGFTYWYWHRLFFVRADSCRQSGEGSLRRRFHQRRDC